MSINYVKTRVSNSMLFLESLITHKNIRKLFNILVTHEVFVTSKGNQHPQESSENSLGGFP